MAMCIEQKLLLSGGVQRYSCELLSLNSRVGILRYVIDRNYRVGPVSLSPGDITLALYWEDRPYTLYTWHRTTSPKALYYFNIADSVSLSPESFIWRDLVVDILVDDRMEVHILDENELPAGIAPELRAYINDAKDRIVAHYHDIINEVNALLGKRGLLPALP